MIEGCTNLTNEAFWMPLLIQGRYIVIHNWLVTASTSRSKHTKIIISARKREEITMMNSQ
jgi:hypothetical protein